MQRPHLEGRLPFLLVAALASLGAAFGACEHSFVVRCTDLSDLRSNGTRSEWQDLLVQPPDDGLLPDCAAKRHVLSATLLTNELNNLKWFAVVANLKGIKSNAFFYLRNSLEYLALFGNDLGTLPRRTVSRFRHARRISLRNNRIKHVDQQAFADSTIDVLDLSHNGIDIVKSRQFITCRLKELDLGHNRLSQIDEDAFPGDLEVLHLHHNNLTNLADTVFFNLSKLWKLRLGHNDISQFFELSSLKMLTFLDLSFNKINSVTQKLHDLPNLEHLDLSRNNIRYIDLQPIANLNKFHKRIKLNYNKLTNLAIPERELLSTITVDLYGNPWNCRCLEEIEKYITNITVFRSFCDRSSFNSGKSPICITSSTCTDDYATEKDVEIFKSQNVNCDYFN